MPRRRIVEATVVQISEEIQNIDTKLEKNAEESKALKQRKKELLKDLKAAEKQEAEAAKKRELEDLVALLNEKGLTVEDVKNILDK
ncbi:MAG: hypothetical protein Q4C91_17530 [Eubacteriales bacterium]|nr:hypothetical protein [Eubacteriales bacterium]